MSRMTLRALERGQGSLASLERYIRVLAPKAGLKEPARPSWDRATHRRGDDQFTPVEFIVRIVEVFGPIDLDPAWHPASPVSAATAYSIAEGRDGLVEPWLAEMVWLNPPFSQLLRWLRKADQEWAAGRAKTIVCLVPARTDSAYFHDRLAAIADIYLLRRRLRFVQLDGRPGNQSPFALMVLLFGATECQRRALEQRIAGLWVQRSSRSG